ncbi:MAG: hypothetical protein U0835_04740 [Isosphaeraceae bacterium]
MPFDPYNPRQAMLRDNLGLLNQQITGLNNIAAGAQADDAAEAATALARQDDFARDVAVLRPLAAGLTADYDRLRRDRDVQTDLARLTRLENRPLRLGPVEDYGATLETLASAMDGTRALTTLPGRVAPITRRPRCWPRHPGATCG